MYSSVYEPLKIGCSECGKRYGHHSFCSKSTLSTIDYAKFLTPVDMNKISRVKTWAYVDNPVSGTCRNCGHRGLVDDPCIGLY